MTPSLTKRLGLAVIPLSCLFIRASIQTYHMLLSTHLPMPMPMPIPNQHKHPFPKNQPHPHHPL